MKKQRFKRKNPKSKETDEKPILRMDNRGAGNEPMNIVFGILVSLALIGIIVSKIAPASSGWTAEMADKMSVIFDYSPDDPAEP